MARANRMVRKVLEQDRVIVVVAVAVVAGLSWAWLATASHMTVNPAADGQMPDMEGMSMTGTLLTPAQWSPAYAGAMLAMWAIMMVAMMLPSASPVLLLFLKANARHGEDSGPLLDTAAFALGYLCVWFAFSIVATGAQWILDATLLMAPEMRVNAPWLGAAILLAAGAWQLTPLKGRCLNKCRSPLGFLTLHWQPGIGGAMRMGLRHGLYCVGCCWVLMALLFLGGIMNLYWIAGLAIFVALEKLAPHGHLLGKAAGVVLMGAALLMMAHAIAPFA